MRPDLNIDLGELPQEPQTLYSLAHRVSVACGGHAGDEESMRLSCILARQAGAHVGAHPSFEDRAHFGRRFIALSPEQLHESVYRQCSILTGVASSVGLELAHVKPHGALYHAANGDPALAEALVAATVAAVGRVPLVGPPSGELARAAAAAGLSFLREGFADRRYLPDGTLASRSDPGALIADPEAAADQALSLASSGRFDTLCVHSDSPGAVEIARAVRRAIERRPS